MAWLQVNDIFIHIDTISMIQKTKENGTNIAFSPDMWVNVPQPPQEIMHLIFEAEKQDKKG